VRILYVCGIVPEAPARLRPLPPLDSGAPHGNIYRLVEETGRLRPDWSLTVLSCASADQLGALRSTVAASSGRVSYRWVIVPDSLRRVSASLFRRLSLSRVALTLMTGIGSLQSWRYVRAVRQWYRKLDPHLLVLDDGPQFIRPLARFVPRARLSFYCRGDMGESRRRLHLAGRILVTNDTLGQWVRSLNPGVTWVRTVPNSLPPELLDASPPEPGAGDFKNVLFVGRLNPVKGPDCLIKAFAMVRDRDPCTRLVIVGSEGPTDGAPGSYSRALRDLAGSLLPPDAVVWRGWLSGQSLCEAYRTSTVAVFPSRCAEGFGMVALEAMACGVPVVASRRPGFEYLLGSGRGVLVDDPENVEELAAAILRVLQDPSAAARMAAAGKAFAGQFTPRRSAEAFIEAVSEPVGDDDA
jgi:glycosyltransferase involved in cell wall biosynthesis